jgi:prolyl-tRNA synthetase
MNDILNSKSGFVEAYWNGNSETEQKIKDITKATIRCIPLEENSTGKCIISGDLNSKKVLFARAY